MRLQKIAAALLGLAIGTVAVGSAFAALSEDRAANMKHIRYAYGQLYQMLRNDSFDPATAQQGATAIAAGLAQLKDLFPAGSQTADDRASADIWNNRPGFEALRGTAYEAALSMAKAPDPASFTDAFQKLGQACRSCHDKFANLN